MLIKVTGPDTAGFYTATMYDDTGSKPWPITDTCSADQDKAEAVERCKRAYQAKVAATTEWLSYDNEAA
jgi:hypothetical protein